MNTLRAYPHQFWLLFAGTFINRMSLSIIWPFLTIFMRETLGVTLTTVTLLFTVSSVTGLAASFIISPLMDRFGRRGMMVGSLFAVSATLMAMTLYDTFGAWVVMTAVYGAVTPVFLIGSNTMVADLIEPQRRVNAYALLRMVANAGIAIGPALGALLVLTSFELAYQVAAAGNLVLAAVSIAVLPETLPVAQKGSTQRQDGGYRVVLRDKLFIGVVGVFILALMAYSQMFILLPVYITENFNIAENQIGLMLTLNAAMVVLLQYPVTQRTKRFRPLPVIALGALFYAAGTGSVALGAALPAFLLSMVILTVGELIINPTATALVAELAPANMRARYMGIFSLAFTIGAGLGPVAGGYLNDHIAPVAIWYGAMAMAFCAVVGFLVLAKIRWANMPRPVDALPAPANN